MGPRRILVACAWSSLIDVHAWEAIKDGWEVSHNVPWKNHTGSLAVTIARTGKVLLMGGQAGEHGGGLLDCFECTKEVWSFDPAEETWEDLSADVPWDPRWGHSAAVTGDGMVWVLFGCCERERPGVMFRDIWTYDAAVRYSWRKVQTHLPFEGIQAASVAVRNGEDLWVCGGWSMERGTLNMVAVLSTRTLEWTVAAHHGEVPWKHRADHASAIPSSGAWMYLYSGQHRDEKTGHWFRLKDMWRVALPRAKLEDWHQLGDLNAARSSVPVLVLPSGWLLALGGHFVADDEEIKAKGQEDVAGMIDHHRQKDFKAYNDVLALHVDEPTATTWHVVEEDAPWPARDDCAAAVVGDSVLLFGGGTVYGGGGYLGDVWRLPSASRRYGLKGAAGGRGGDRGSGEL